MISACDKVEASINDKIRVCICLGGERAWNSFEEKHILRRMQK
jgi:hypothetical protein